jgi:hypothetical protein
MAIRILVIDDEEDLCEILQFNLEGEGFDVDVAFSAEEALKKDIRSYQLILLDVMMGKISGFKLAKIIRQEMKLDPSHPFHNSEGRGKQYPDRLQPWCRRLYHKTFLRQGSHCQGKGRDTALGHRSVDSREKAENQRA